MSSLPACYQNKGLRSVFIKGRAYTVERTGKLHVLYRDGRQIAFAHRVKGGWAVHPPERDYRATSDKFASRLRGFESILRELGEV